MKKLILLTIALLTLFTCKKEETEENTEKEYRLKEIIYTGLESDSSYKYILNYNNVNRLELIDGYYLDNSKEWIKTDKLEIEYSNQRVDVKYYYFENEIWVNGESIYFIYNNDGKISKYASNDNFEQSTYEYTDELLTKKIYSDHDGDIFVFSYIYIDGSLSQEQIEYDSGPQTKREFVYENEKMSSSIYSTRWNLDEEWEQEYKREFSYDNELLSSIVNYIFDTNNQWEERVKDTFFYDLNNVLQSYSVDFQEFNDDSYTITFVCEEGQCNIEKFILPEDKLYPYPNFYSFYKNL